MEMDREDGTGPVLALSVDVNENRAEACGAHTLHPHRNRLYTTSQEMNGFPEPRDLKDGEPGSDTAGFTGSDTAGFTGSPEYSGDPNLNRSGKRQPATSGLQKWNVEEDGNVWGFGPKTSGDARGTRSSWPACGGTVRPDVPLVSSGQTNPADVFRSAESDRATSAGNNINANWPGSGAESPDAGLWESDGVPDVTGETAARNQWMSVETSDTTGSGAVAVNISTSGSCANMVSPEGPTNIWRTSAHLGEVGNAVGGRGGDLSSRGETDGARRIADSIFPEETNTSPDVSREMFNPDTSGERTRRTGRDRCVGAETEGNSEASASDGMVDVGEHDGTGRNVPGLSCEASGTCGKVRVWSAAGENAAPEAGEKKTPLDGAGAFPAGNSPPGKCFGKRPGSCCTETERKIPNGEFHSHAGGSFHNTGVRVGNCGYLVINRRSVSGTPVYSVSDPRNAAEPRQDARSPSDPGRETPTCVADKASERPEDGVGAARPRSLRTHPGQGASLSCDSTPLDEGHMGYFVDDGDMDVIMNSLEVGRRQSAPDKLLQNQNLRPGPSADPSETRRHGFTDFISRSLFSWKPRDTKITAASSAWRLFGKMSSRESTTSTTTSTNTSTNTTTTPSTTTNPSRVPQQQQSDAVRRKALEFEPLSTTGLILEDRPANLPAKPEEEAQRHRQQYDEMMAGAKRRELKEAQRKKKQMMERHRQEESIARALVVWNAEILPNWENMRNTRRVRDLWWQGLPPSIRGKIWSLAIGNELNITPELYEIFLSRAKEKWRSYSETGSLSESEDCGVDKESSLDLIKLDIFRTFPSLFIFQKGGPYHDILHNVLGAYTCYRPDVGYVQGMSFIAAVLILNLEEADAFIAFANLLNKPCHMAFFRVDHDLMLKYFAAFEVFFKENLPKLFQHFHNNSLTPDFYLIDWIFTLYSKPLPLDVACRVWDLFCRDGEEALFRTALGILRLYQDVLLQMDFIHSAQFLSRLPQDTPAHALFHAIANTDMLSNGGRWNQVFSALMKDGSKDGEKSASPALRS